MMYTAFRPVFGGVLFLALALFVGACSDNPVDDHDHDEHFEANGLVLVARAIDTVIVENAQVQGSLTVRAGDSTGYLDLYFLREDDGTRDLPIDDAYSLAWTVGDTTIVSVEAPPSDGHSHVHYEFRLRGLKVGATTLTLRLLHNGHDDFVSPPIPVTVIE